jgi:hypothetical protein
LELIPEGKMHTDQEEEEEIEAEITLEEKL